MTRKFLNEVYALQSQQETIELYQNWSSTYEKELATNGYVTPSRCASAFAEVVIDKSKKIMDIGCGTGLSGEAFAEVGFDNIDGSDFSPQMLKIAESKGIYSKLILTQSESPINFNEKIYTHSAAVGVFSPLHAAPNMVEKMLNIAKINGFFIFSLNDHALENPDYIKEVERLEKQGLAKVIFEEYGDHLPKINLGALIYIIQRLN